MQVTIYLDIIFFINFITDFVVLLLTGVILKQKLSFWRLVSGAFFGAVLLLPVILFPNLLKGITGVFVLMGISMGAVFVSLGKKGGIIKKWFLSTTIMVLLGGLMNYLKCITGITAVKLSKWLVIFAGGTALSVITIYFLHKVIQRENSIYLIKIKNGNRILLSMMYLDTGNMLWDPLFSKPVIVLSEEVVKECLEEEEREVIEQYKKKGQLCYKNVLICKSQRKDCFHEITYQSVGNPSGKLLCFLADEICINGSERILKSNR